MKQLKVRVKSVAEVVELAVQKLSQGQGGKETVVYIPSPFLPPTRRPYRWEEYDSRYGRVRLFSKPAYQGGWVIKVRFSHPIMFNPALPKTVGEELLKNLSSQQ
jgi:hypothetical protein